MTPVDWDGCIEERQTFKLTSNTVGTAFNSIPSSAHDLNIDMEPNNQAGTQWGPSLPGAVYQRRTLDGSGNITSTRSYASVNSPLDMPTASASCPAPARKLTVYSASESFRDYVNALSASGQTYHDIGLAWGGRLISPTGLFADENAFTPTGGSIERHLIFMTDGKAEPSNSVMDAYGLAWYDRRQTRDDTEPSASLLTNLVNARTSLLCEDIKKKGITLWVIYYGVAESDDAERLEICASNNRFYEATNSQKLIDQFKAIASEISQLRLTN